VKSVRQNRNRKEDHVDRSSTPDDLEKLSHDELSGGEESESALASSETDEDEDEGLGDGRIGRSNDDILGRD
jgi:hypothetical protein